MKKRRLSASAAPHQVDRTNFVAISARPRAVQTHANCSTILAPSCIPTHIHSNESNGIGRGSTNGSPRRTVRRRRTLQGWDRPHHGEIQRESELRQEVRRTQRAREIDDDGCKCICVDNIVSDLWWSVVPDSFPLHQVSRTTCADFRLKRSKRGFAEISKCK